jgi:argininosuccinate synthase
MFAIQNNNNVNYLKPLSYNSNIAFSARIHKVPAGVDKFVSSSKFSPELSSLLGDIKNKYGYLKDKNVLMLFSGGLDTSFLAKVLKEEIGANVNTLTFNLGDLRVSAKKIKKQADRIGIENHLEVNATEEFIQEYVLPSIKANAKYNGRHPLSSSLSRPLMMKKAVKLAKELNCNVIIQGTSPWQNNAPRFQKAFSHLSNGTKLKMELPVLELDIDRKLEQEYLKSFGLKIEDREDKIFSADGNIWNWEAEDGDIAKKQFYRPNLQSKYFNLPENAPDEPQFLNITFDKGIPVKLNGKSYDLKTIIEKLNKIGGKHGVGIHDALEARPLGFKEREIHISPAADILITAHQDLEQSVLADDLLTFKQFTDGLWTKAVCDGDWFREAKNVYDAAIEKTQEKVSGTIKVKLFKGHIDIHGRTSPNSLDAKTLNVENQITPSKGGFQERAFLSKIGR